MDNLIDRKVLLREMEKLYNKYAVDAYMTGDKEIRVSWNDAVYLVTVAPTVEAEPIKHGRWIGINRNRYNDDEATCSICGATFASGYSNPSWWDYCPNCGARMDEKETDFYSIENDGTYSAGDGDEIQEPEDKDC